MDRMRYLPATSLLTAYLLWTKKVRNVHGLGPDDVVQAPLHPDDSSPGRGPMLLPEAMIIEVMN